MLKSLQNTRYYDPLLGRFITPDTIVQSPYDPQTLNRYAYCRNNPIIYTDPSGHSFLGKALGIASMAINWQNSLLNIAGHAAFGKVNSFDTVMRYSYQGQVLGAAIGASATFGVLVGPQFGFSPESSLLSSILSTGGGYGCSRMGNCTWDQRDGAPSEPRNRRGGRATFTPYSGPGPLDLYPSYAENKDFDYSMLSSAVEDISRRAARKLEGLRGTFGVDVGYAFLNVYSFIGLERGNGFVKGMETSLTTSLVGFDFSGNISVPSQGPTLTTSFGQSKYFSTGVMQDLSGRGGLKGFVGFSFSVGPGVGLPGANWSINDVEANNER